jgi:hypothetical protein
VGRGVDDEDRRRVRGQLETQYKVSADSVGPGGTRLFDDRKDRGVGIGGEASRCLPKPKVLIDVRVIPEFGAVNRTEGLTFMVTLAYQARSLVKVP